MVQWPDLYRRPQSIQNPGCCLLRKRNRGRAGPVRTSASTSARKDRAAKAKVSAHTRACVRPGGRAHSKTDIEAPPCPVQQVILDLTALADVAPPQTMKNFEWGGRLWRPHSRFSACHRPGAAT